jgi:hypothetical protein
MANNDFKKVTSTGRARGRSMLSILRATNQEHGAESEAQSAAGESKYKLDTLSKCATNQTRFSV